MNREDSKKYQREWMRKYRAEKRAALSGIELQAIEDRKLSSRFQKGQIPWNKGIENWIP